MEVELTVTLNELDCGGPGSIVEDLRNVTTNFGKMFMDEEFAELTCKADDYEDGQINHEKRVINFMINDEGECMGCVYEKGGLDHIENVQAAVVVRSFGVDCTQNSPGCPVQLLRLGYKFEGAHQRKRVHWDSDANLR